MAQNTNIYDRSDVVRLIVRGGGYCVDNTADNAKKKAYFCDMSPACMGLAPKDSELEKVLAIFDSQESSRRVFNEIHIKEGDRNLTIGCGNYASDSLAELFLGMPEDAWREFRLFIVEKLKGNSDFFNQFCDDYVIVNYLKKLGINSIRFAAEKDRLLPDAVDYFFCRDLLDGKEYSDIRNDKELKNRYLHDGKALTILDKDKRYLSLWADTVLLLSAFDPKTNRPQKPYDVYDAYTEVYQKIACTKFENRKEDKTSNLVCARLFPGYDKHNSGACRFWFYSILFDALLLKSVANWQHRMWVKNYYDACEKNWRTLCATDRSILAGLVSWKSNGLYASSNPPFNLAVGTTPENWRNMGNRYYLKSAKEVLVANNQDDCDAKQDIVDACLARYGELFTGLVVWAQFIKTKKKIRSRLRTMWSVYFENTFKQFKDNPDTKPDADHISFAELILTSYDLRLEIKETRDDKCKVHGYTLFTNTKNSCYINSICHG